MHIHMYEQTMHRTALRRTNEGEKKLLRFCSGVPFFFLSSFHQNLWKVRYGEIVCECASRVCVQTTHATNVSSPHTQITLGKWMN